jgi:phosphoribosyl 1,2-cyclic phosphodiesterase
VEVAKRAGVDRLALFHHDPTRGDDGIAAIEAEARSRFARVMAAREGAPVLL